MSIDPKITETIAAFTANFGDTFGLAGYAGRTFRLSPTSSYINDNGEVVLYTQLCNNGVWMDFAKGNMIELRREIIDLRPVVSVDEKAVELVAAMEHGEATAKRVVVRGEEFRGAMPEAILAGFGEGTPRYHAFVAGFLAACPHAIHLRDGKIV